MTIGDINKKIMNKIDIKINNFFEIKLCE